MHSIISILTLWAIPGIYLIMRTVYLLELNYNIKINKKSTWIITWWTLGTLLGWPFISLNESYNFLKTFLHQFITKINR